MGKSALPDSLSLSEFRALVWDYEERALRRALGEEERELVSTLALLALSGFRKRRKRDPLQLPAAALRLLEVFRAHGPMTAQAAGALVPQYAFQTVLCSVSALIGQGRLRPTGRREPGTARSRGRVYEVTPKGKES